MSDSPTVVRRIGVLGTLVWDTLVRDTRVRDTPNRDSRVRAHEDRQSWGGIAFSIEALHAALPAAWRIVPLIRVGRDLELQARAWLATIPRLDLDLGLRVVDEPNNRVELRYTSASERVERLSGGVSGWPAGELAEAASQLDALYVNFISGFELTLPVARTLRDAVSGPLHADLHSLFLGIEDDGTRVPQSLERADAWLDCFDSLQLNEREFASLAPSPAAARERLHAAVCRGVQVATVTLGGRGVDWLARTSPDLAPGRRPDRRPLEPSAAQAFARGHHALPLGERGGDPTGCGDVWGATFFARMLADDSLSGALERANRAAAHKLSYPGAPGLHTHLQGLPAHGDDA